MLRRDKRVYPVGITILVGGAAIIVCNAYLFIKAYQKVGFRKGRDIRTATPTWHMTRATLIEYEAPESLSMSSRYAGLPGNAFNLDRRLGK